MFFDFSSAFNTIQPHLLAEKLMKMKVSPYTILWILDYLTSRPQFVKITSPCFQKVQGVQILSSKTFLSDTKVTNTGCPQGTVLSPYLFSLYTSDYRDNHELNTLVKYADDTFLLSLIIDYVDKHFSEATFNFVHWCKKNFLDLNVPKTKEMNIDFRKNPVDPAPIIIENEEVKRLMFLDILVLLLITS